MKVNLTLLADRPSYEKSVELDLVNSILEEEEEEEPPRILLFRGKTQE